MHAGPCHFVCPKAIACVGKQPREKEPLPCHFRIHRRYKRNEPLADTVMIDPIDEAGSSEYNGVTFHFCAVTCKARSETNPERYLAAL